MGEKETVAYTTVKSKHLEGEHVKGKVILFQTIIANSAISTGKFKSRLYNYSI